MTQRSEVPTINEEIILYVGNAPPAPKAKITISQEITNLGISKASEVNALLRDMDSRDVTITIINPTDISLTSSTGVVASEYRRIMEGIKQPQVLISELPTILNSGTRLVWLATNGNVIAILIQDKPVAK